MRKKVFLIIFSSVLSILFMAPVLFFPENVFFKIFQFLVGDAGNISQYFIIDSDPFYTMYFTMGSPCLIPIFPMPLLFLLKGFKKKEITIGSYFVYLLIGFVSFFAGIFSKLFVLKWILEKPATKEAQTLMSSSELKLYKWGIYFLLVAGLIIFFCAKKVIPKEEGKTSET